MNLHYPLPLLIGGFESKLSKLATHSVQPQFLDFIDKLVHQKEHLLHRKKKTLRAHLHTERDEVSVVKNQLEINKRNLSKVNLCRGHYPMKKFIKLKIKLA